MAKVVFHENDFDYDDFVASMQQEAKLLDVVSGETARELLEASKGDANWDSFYRREDDPYKPRRYLSAEFPELLHGPSRLLRALEPLLPSGFIRFGLVQKITGSTNPLLFDVGCGYGSALIPLLRENPCLHAIACDLSPTAVAKLAAHPELSNRHVQTRPWDITQGLPPELSALGGGAHRKPVDLALLIFTLSAVDPALHVKVRGYFDKGRKFTDSWKAEALLCSSRFFVI